MKRIAVILLVLCASMQLFAQTFTTKVRGSVTDAQTGEPIPFAGIYFKDTTIGITDAPMPRSRPTAVSIIPHRK